MAVITVGKNTPDRSPINSGLLSNRHHHARADSFNRRAR
jgi:hypothetical protein